MSKRKASSLFEKVMEGAITQMASKRSRLSSMSRRRRSKKTAVSARRLLPKISRDPFPKEFRTKLTWNGDTAYLAPGSTSTYTVIALTGLYDPDNTNNLGNFQPLFFDQLLSATGPYQKYRVNGWKGKATIINASANDGAVAIPLDVYYKQGGTNVVDLDTWAEVQSQPGVQTLLVGPPGSDTSTRTMYFNGKLDSYIPATADAEDYVGAYNANPTQPIYGSFVFKNAKVASISNILVFLKVSIEFDVTVYAQDGAQS